MNLIQQETHPHCPNCLIAYAAGYFDGEGCISVLPAGGKHHLTLRIAILSGDSNSQQIMASAIGGKSYQIRSRTAKPLYRWALNGPRATEALRMMLPFLQAKRPQAELVLNSGYLHLSRGGGARTSQEQKDIRQALREALAAEKRK